MSATSDWSSSQYLKFEAERTRPSRDLLAQVPLEFPETIVDLGCGPGNSTAVIAARYPDSRITGMDSSPDMIKKAKATLPNIEFTLGDLHTYPPKEPTDLFFTNAVFQWVPYADRIPIIKRLIQTQSSGGVFALQVPDNANEPSHAGMRIAALEGPWAKTLSGRRTALDPFQTPQELYDEIKPLCSSLDIWHTNYEHVLDDHWAVVEWVKGTGLRPFVDPLSEVEKEGFLKAYLERIKKAYPAQYDGKVLLRYPRLFMVAVRA
ncbi:S-adenosyl-L-methionine-dependent methyltransferase [Rhizodiscina lignyota]|uniref:S-adenosyl-L-methionine-dependent methyltransferase n=1 Tax=Rhizodiscina lignyota TaxID=1504668 RepID=A0A9P4ICS5_9PEZI|nr:S-adenosyl-L-methionine-dependent methyltransferase [Rhizodiscina lignyota]